MFRERHNKRRDDDRDHEERIMKLFVIGATGRTGREIVEQALARGHRVTAFVRSPESITSRNERLAVIKGNAMDENELFNAMQNHDAVLSTLGPREVFKPSSMLHDSALATTRTMNRSGVKRLLILSAAAHFPGVENVTYRSREGAAPSLGFTLARKAVAAFMLDAIEQQKHFQKIVGIAK